MTITLKTTDTERIATNIVETMENVKHTQEFTEKDKHNGRIIFIKAILDEFRRRVAEELLKPSIN
jgi:hypothetical protein